jgi:hypothetical protein
VAAMVESALAGAALGLGLFVLLRALFPARPGLVARLLALDAVREDAGAPRIQLLLPDEEVSAFRRGLGARLARLYGARGWEARSAKSDLALLGRSFEAFLATKVLLAASGLLAFPLLLAWLVLMEWGVSLAIPFWTCSSPSSSSSCQISRSSGTRRPSDATSATSSAPSSTSSP